MIRSDLDRLRDARDFALYARDNAGGLPADVLADAIQPQHAALFDLVVIGEALNKIPREVRSAAPALRWQAVIGMRHFVVHAYWQIDLEIIADVIKNRIDPLVSELNRLITMLELAEQ